MSEMLEIPVRVDNLKIWDAVKTPPPEAMKKIAGGRLSGMTDISPQWRIKIMTEMFGAVGFGWTYEIEKQWLEKLEGVSDVCAFSNIRLKYKADGEKGEWSEWIQGTGGSKIATMEKGGLHVSDECYKMATTDALSVAMKAIGVGADVYLGQVDHSSKYSEKKGNPVPANNFIKPETVQKIKKEMKKSEDPELLWESVRGDFKKVDDISVEKVKQISNSIVEYLKNENS